MTDNERILGRPRDTIRLLGIPETNALQDRVMEIQHNAYRLHNVRSFSREEEIARSIEDWQKPAFVNPERLAAYTGLLAKLATGIPDESVFILTDQCGVFGAIPSTIGEIFSRGLAFFDPYGHNGTWILGADGQNALYMGTHWPSFHIVAVLTVLGRRWTTPLDGERGGIYRRPPEDPELALEIARAARIVPYRLEFFSTDGTFNDAMVEWSAEWRAALARGCQPVNRTLSPAPRGGTMMTVTFSCPDAEG